MGRLHANDQKDAIDQARLLTRLANIIHHRCDNDSEEILLTNFLCSLRDNQVVIEPHVPDDSDSFADWEKG